MSALNTSNMLEVNPV